jgi:integrase/recombinase XerD
MGAKGRRPVPLDALERRVVGAWRQIRLSAGTRTQYLHCVRRFRRYWSERGLDGIEQLTLAGVKEYAAHYVGPSMSRPAPATVLDQTDSAVYAWAHALRELGHRVPPWRPPPSPTTWPPLVAEYLTYRREHRGVGARTRQRDASTVTEFLALLRDRRRALSTVRAIDLDAFVAQVAHRLGRIAVRDTCCHLRSFLRFLHVTGRASRDLASLVVAPRVRAMERPPRALAWPDVRCLLRAIPRDTPTGRRDFAVVLMMATYGLGAAEVVALRLDDIDWRHAVLRLRRPKTGAPLELPLLPAVAHAVAAYLREGRPPDAVSREAFVGARLPRRPMSTSAVRHLLRWYARRAGLRVPVGGHTLRHSHATRQIDAGVNPKLVGDILGHRRPASTSVYVRVALQRLRAVALPVP